MKNNEEAVELFGETIENMARNLEPKDIKNEILAAKIKISHEETTNDMGKV